MLQCWPPLQEAFLYRDVIQCGSVSPESIKRYEKCLISSLSLLFFQGGLAAITRWVFKIKDFTDQRAPPLSCEHS